MSDAIVRLKIGLEDTDPPIWRRVEVPAATTLKDLHGVIQAAMGWEDAHLFEFMVGRERIGTPDPDGWGERATDARRVRLEGLVARGVKRFAYVYDFGDDWRHALRIEKTLAAEPDAAYPRLIDGAGRCPPEDVGGIPGFYAFLDAVADPKHPEHDELVDWYGGAFDPEDMDEGSIRERLARIAARRHRAGAKRASSKSR